MTKPADLEYVRKHIREVKDFPKPGIIFLDITTATKDAKSLRIKGMETLFQLNFF